MKKIQIIVTAILCAVLMTACASAEELFSEANTAFEQGQWEKAIKASEKFLKKSDSPEQIQHAKEIIETSTVRIKWDDLQEYIEENKDTIEFNTGITADFNENSIIVKLDNNKPDITDSLLFNYGDTMTLNYTIGDETATYEFCRYDACSAKGGGMLYSLEDKITGKINVPSFAYGSEIEVESYGGDELIFLPKGENACITLGRDRMTMLLSIFEESCLEPVGLSLHMLGFHSY